MQNAILVFETINAFIY